MRARETIVALSALVTVTALAFTSCNDDGRTLRPARPDQNASVSTLAPPTTVDPALVTVDPVFGDVGFDPPETDPANSLPGETLPAESVGSTTAMLTSSFADGGVIDPQFTCDGANTPPPLSWTNAPGGTAEIAVTLTDDDAPGFVHWAMAGIDPLATELTELTRGVVPDGAIVALNSTGTKGYFGPCPPPGSNHTYRLTVHFLAQATELSGGSLGTDLLAAVDGATFDSVTITATFRRG